MSSNLTPEALHLLLEQHPAWSLHAGMLVRTATFDTFPEAMAAVNRIAHAAEQANHHPDIDIRYTSLRLALISHDAAALTSRDAAMVRKLDELLAR